MSSCVYLENRSQRYLRYMEKNGFNVDLLLKKETYIQGYEEESNWHGEKKISQGYIQY